MRVGPLVATVEPTTVEPTRQARPATRGSVDGAEAPHPGPGPAPPPVAAVPSGAPARIGATIGALERLLIVAFMLTGADRRGRRS